MRPHPAAQHPAARLLLVYAACLALMLVTAVAIASMRNAPAAQVDQGRAVETGAPIQATAR